MKNHSVPWLSLMIGLGCLSLPAFAFAQGGQGSATAAPPPAATTPASTAPAASAPAGDAPAPAQKLDLPPAVLEEAQRIYQMGQSAYAKGRYDSAFTSFSQAYQLTKAPDLLYNLAKVSVKLGQKEVAVGYYRQYLAGHPADEVTVQKELDDLQGPSVVPSAPPPPVEASADPQIPRWVPWAMIGGGAGLLGISIGLLVAGGITPTDSAGDRSQQRGLLASGGVLGGIGLAATVGGVVLRLRDKKNLTPKPAQVLLLPQGLGLQLVGSF